MLQFLQHDGYIETARAFAEEVQTQKQALSLDPDKPIEGINITDDEDANRRQRKCLEADWAGMTADTLQAFGGLFWKATSIRR